MRLLDLSPQHLDAVVALESRGHPGGWSRQNLEDELAHAGARIRGVMEGEELLAYAAWREVPDELWLLNLVVAPERRREGVARALLEDGAALARTGDATTLWLEVRVSNEAARALYRAAGFVEQSRRRGYYRPLVVGAPREDALLMRRTLVEK